MASVARELPFLKNSPPMAGISAKANGTDAQFELSWLSSVAPLGLKISSEMAE